MNLRKTLHNRFTMPVLTLAMLVVALACAGDAAPTSMPTEVPPAPTGTSPAMAVPTATGVPDVALNLDYATMDSILQNPGYKEEWGTPKYGGIVKYRTTWPQTLNAPWNASMYRIFTTPQYNVLMRRDPWVGANGPVHPDLAESWMLSGDGLTLTLNLRQGVMFRDPIPQDAENGLDDMPGRGTEFTCEDAKASLDFYGTPGWTEEKGGSSARGHLTSNVAEVTCADGPDGYTLVLSLAFPKPSIFDELAYPGVVMVDKDWLEWLRAEHPGEVNRENWFLNMGTGAFVPEALQQDIVTKTRRNPNHWREGVPFVDGVDVHVIRDFSTAFTSWASGAIDILGQGSGSMTPGNVRQALRDFSEKPLLQHQYTGGQGNDYNTTRPPFDNVQVRQAADMVIDRRLWHQATHIDGDLYKSEISGMHGPGGFWGNPIEDIMTWPGYREDRDVDIAEANRILDDVYGAGERPVFTCLSRSDQNYVDRCIFVADQWTTNLGAEVDLRILEGVVALELSRACQYDTVSGWPNGLTTFIDPWDRYANFKSTGLNFNPCRAGVDADVQAKVNSLIDQIERELDSIERNRLTKELERIWMQEAIYGSTMEFQNLYYGSQPWMQGVFFPDHGVFGFHNWIHERYWKDNE